MKGVYTQKNSPYYWLRYYDQLEQDPNRKRKSVNTKISITPADKRRILDARSKGGSPQLQGTPELRKLVKEFKGGLAQRNIEARSGVKLLKKLLLTEGLKEYIFYRPNLKKATIYAYEYAVKQMIAAATDKQIHRYNKKDYTLLVRYSKEQNFSQSSVAIITRHLSSLWNYFIESQYARENIIIKFKTPQGVPCPIPPKDLKIILNYYTNKGILAQEYTVLFLLFTGFRPSTAVVQVWEWIDLENGLLTAYNVKSSRSFVFPIHSELDKLLRKIGPKTNGLVLGYKSVDSLKFFTRDMNKLYSNKMISKKYSLYNLRDTFASHLANNNLDVSSVQELLNHSNIKITRGHYVEIQTKYLRQKIDSANFEELVRQKAEDLGNAIT